MTNAPAPTEELKSRLIWLMSNHHQGRDHAAKKAELLVELWGEYAVADRSYNNPYDRALRTMIEDIDHNQAGLICSTPQDGYFWAASLEDGLPAVEKNIQRALTQLENAKHLEKNLQDAFGGQLRLV